MRPPFREALRKALRCRCPNCGRGPVFARWPNKVLPCCPHCGLTYFRESGYYVGGMIVTYGLAAAVLISVYLVLLLFPDVKILSENVKSVLWFVFAILLTLALVRHSYSLWLALDFWIEPWKPGEPK